MNDEWIHWEEGLAIVGETRKGNDGKRWAVSQNIPFIQEQKNRRILVSRLACEKLRESRKPDISGVVTQDAKNHPEFYEINIKITVSHALLATIFNNLQEV